MSFFRMTQKKCARSNIAIIAIRDNVIDDSLIIRVSYTFDFLQALCLSVIWRRAEEDLKDLDEIQRFLQFGENIKELPESATCRVQEALESAIRHRHQVCIRSSVLVLMHVKRICGKDVMHIISKHLHASIDSYEWEFADINTE